MEDTIHHGKTGTEKSMKKTLHWLSTMHRLMETDTEILFDPEGSDADELIDLYPDKRKEEVILKEIDEECER